MNKQKFQKSLQSLGSWREGAFILGLAERALPNLILFFSSSVLDSSVLNSPTLDSPVLNNAPLKSPEVEESGAGIDFNAMMESIWQSLILEPSEEAIIELLDEVVSHLPEIEDSDSYGALPSADCISLLEQALLSGINDEKRRALEASQTSLNTVIQFIEFSEDEGLSENQLVKLFDTHPLVEREFSFQTELNDLLRSASHPGTELISALRVLAQDKGVSNIGISLS